MGKRRLAALMMAVSALGLQARVLPETIVCTQAQLYPWREQARGYLGRYPNQPLLVDPDLPEDADRDGISEFPGWGSFHSQADYDITMREAKAMGIDGLALFALRPSRFFKAGADCQVEGMLSLPIVCFWEKDVAMCFREIEVALNNPRAYTYKGKFLLPSYWTAKYNTPEELKAKYDAIRAKYGDRFLFIAAVPTLSGQVGSYDRDGRVFTAAMTNHVETACRAYARVADGIQICEAHMQAKVERGERVFSETYWDTVHSIVRRVLDEPEFRGRKLLCSAAVNGHMNAYRGTYNTSEDCTRTLRASFETAIRYDADYIMLPEWDELNENTCYEPSLYGSHSVKRIVRHYMDLVKKRPHAVLPGDDVSKPNLIVTYRKSLEPGEPLTVEVLNVPDGSRDGTLSAAIELTDENGTHLRTFEPRTIDETKLQDERFVADTVELAPKARAVRVRLVWKKGWFRGGTVFEGLHPVDLAPGNAWNHLCAKQAIRDLAEPDEAKVAFDGSRVRADLSCDEPIRYAMLCGNGCIQAIRGREGSDADRFREDADHAVFQLTAYFQSPKDLRARKGEPPFSYSVKGVPEAEWYFVKDVTKGERYDFRVIRGEGYSPSVYLRIPKSRLGAAVLSVALGDKTGELPLDRAFAEKSYGTQLAPGLQLIATRFGLQARYPSVANAKAVSFVLAVDRDRASMMYHVQFTTMSGKVWFSRPFVSETGDATKVTTRVWSGLRGAAVDVELPAARVPVLAYDFSPKAGTVIAPTSGERHWYGVLGGPNSMAGLWNRGCRTDGAVPTAAGEIADPDGSVPKRVREPDGGWSLAFDGVGDYLGLPWGTTPTFAGCTVSFDVCPERFPHPKKVASLYCAHGNLRDIGLKEDGELVLSFAEMLGARNFETHVRLEFDKWSNIRLVNAGDRLEVSVNGKTVKSYPISLPGHSSSGTTVGGFPNWSNLCFFKGKVKNLIIDHRTCN